MIRIRRSRLLVVTAALTAAVSGCSSPAQKPAPEVSARAVPPTADPAVDYYEPAQVCHAFAAAVHRADTTVDRGPEDAYRRAAAYMNARLANAVAVAHPAPLTSQWQLWAAHRAYVDVRLDPYAGDALPPASAGEQHHAAVVTAWPIGRDGWRGPAQRHTVVCALRPADTGWRVSGYEIG